MVIPFFGAIVATFPPVLVALTQSLELGLWTFLAIVVIQNVMTNVIGPRLMAQTVGIHPLLVFAALLVGAHVAGLWGVFLALPVAGILNVFARYAVEVAQGRRARTEASRMLSEREQRRARR
jgi:predicted PurR-regulated permease PerM